MKMFIRKNNTLFTHKKTKTNPKTGRLCIRVFPTRQDDRL